jgi:Protein of unknown function (DUF3011)
MKKTWPALALVLVASLGAPVVASAQQVTCESKNYEQNFCPTGMTITSAWLVTQRSRSPCIQGQSWGFQNQGIWVSQGCEADFAFQGVGGPPVIVAQAGRPGGLRVVCESRNYQQQWCPAGQQITSAWVIDQRSQSPCIQGQTWGYQNNDIWVTQGCAAEFGIQGYNAPIAPPVSGNIVCESRDYTQSYCPVGQYFARAWLVAQRSRSPCQQGRTWGYDRNGIWVTQGCAGEFSFE